MIAITIVVLVGVIAGVVNVIAGAGSLLTFPALLAAGLPAVVANVTNDIGITVSNISGVWGMRHDLQGQRKLILKLLLPVATGSILGAILLLLLPGHIFEWIAPFMLLGASLLTLFKDWVLRHNGALRKLPHAYGTTVFLMATYGGYFGAGIGLLFMAGLTIFQNSDIKTLNAIKNVMQLAANGIAGLIFVFFGHINWLMALVMTLGTLIGAQIGARISHRISADKLRIVISSLGMLAALGLFIENFM